MNRSRVRNAAISGVIACGLMAGGAGGLGAVMASASPGDGASRGSDRASGPSSKRQNRDRASEKASGRAKDQVRVRASASNGRGPSFDRPRGFGANFDREAGRVAGKEPGKGATDAGKDQDAGKEQSGERARAELARLIGRIGSSKPARSTDEPSGSDKLDPLDLRSILRDFRHIADARTDTKGTDWPGPGNWPPKWPCPGDKPDPDPEAPDPEVPDELLALGGGGGGGVGGLAFNRGGTLGNAAEGAGNEVPGALEPPQLSWTEFGDVAQTPGQSSGASVVQPPAPTTAVPAVAPPAPVVPPPVPAPSAPVVEASPVAPIVQRAFPSRPPESGRPPAPAAELDKRGQTVSYRAGYPEYLRSAAIAEVAGLALPGVAGLLALTAAGGLLGYRQAKIGRAMQAAEAARFLR